MSSLVFVYKADLNGLTKLGTIRFEVIPRKGDHLSLMIEEKISWFKVEAINHTTKIVPMSSDSSPAYRANYGPNTWVGDTVQIVVDEVKDHGNMPFMRLP
jgi:hypothetical protein